MDPKFPNDIKYLSKSNLREDLSHKCRVDSTFENQTM